MAGKLNVNEQATAPGTNRLPKNYAQIKTHPSRPAKKQRAKRDWRAYEEAQRERYSIALFIDKALIQPSKWYGAEAQRGAGRPRVYSDAASLACLQLGALLRLPLRGAEHTTNSILELMGARVRAPDHVTLFRARQRLAASLNLPRPGTIPPRWLVIDGTGLAVSGQGEWRDEKWGADAAGGGTERFARLTIALDYDSGQVVAFTLQPASGAGTGELSQTPALLAQLSDEQRGSVVEVIGDALYDTKDTYEAVASIGASLVTPPRATAQYGLHADRDRSLKTVNWHGEEEWKRRVDYGRRSMVETTIGRLKAATGGRLRAKTMAGQRAEVAVRISALNMATILGAQHRSSA